MQGATHKHEHTRATAVLLMGGPSLACSQPHTKRRARVGRGSPARGARVGHIIYDFIAQTRAARRAACAAIVRVKFRYKAAQPRLI